MQWKCVKLKKKEIKLYCMDERKWRINLKIEPKIWPHLNNYIYIYIFQSIGFEFSLWMKCVIILCIDWIINSHIILI